MTTAHVRGALSVDGYLRLRTRTGDVLHEAVPRRMLFVLPTEQPIEHSVTDGRANVGHGHKPFASGASVFQL
jgi:hypothetical protein